MRKTILSVLTLLLLLSLAVPGWAATNNFTANGNWSNTTKWSLGHVPDQSEDVTLSATVTSMVVDTTAWCKAFTPTGTAGVTISGAGDLRPAGNFTLDANVTWTQSGNLEFWGGTSSVNTAGKSLASVNSIQMNFGASVSLANSLNIVTSEIAIYGTGTAFATNGYTVTCGNFGDGGSGGSTTINLGSSTINFKRAEFEGGSTPTITSSGAHLNIASSTTFGNNFGGVNWGDATIAITVDNGNTCHIADAGNTFGTMTATKASGSATLTFLQGGTNNFGSFSASNLTITSSDGAHAATLSDTTGTNAVTNCTLSWLTATGGAAWNAFTTSGNTDGGNNSGWAWSSVSAPTASISAATSVAQTTLTGVGSSSDGGGTVTERGILLKAGGTPTTSSYDFKLTSSGTSGAFAGTGMNVTGLTANTAYTARAYAINEIGTGYSTTTTYTTLRNPGIFYIRADGMAATIVAATGPSTTVANCMNPTVHNAGPFIPGDTIYISDKGGTYGPPAATYNVTVYGLLAPSSGTAGNPIAYSAVPGETPKFDMSMIDNGTGWSSVDLGGGGGTVYQKTAGWDWIGAMWEDGVPLHRVSNHYGDAPGVGTNDTNGILQQWSYSGNVITYKPISGTPASHTLRLMWFNPNYSIPYGISVQNQSFVDVSGLTFDYTAFPIVHGDIAVDINPADPPAIIDGIKIHGNTISHAFWGIWGNLRNNAIEQNTEVYSNTLNYCNSGISTWTAMLGSSVGVGYTQQPVAHNIHHNTMNHHAVVDSTHSWDWAMNDWNLNDHEGISFQDNKDCIVADNHIIGESADHARGINYYMNPGAPATSGNKTLRNRVDGLYDAAILVQADSNFSCENNIYSGNVMNYSGSNTGVLPFAASFNGATNSGTGINYLVSNTINYPNGWGFFKLPGGDTDGYWTIKNNIIISSNEVISLGASLTHFAFDYNDYYSSMGDENGPFAYQTFDQWKNAHPTFDAHSFFHDPALRSTDSALLSTSYSHCLNGGVVLDWSAWQTATGLTFSSDDKKGIDGQAFDGTNPAMGAYAQVGSVVPPTVTTQAVSSVSVTTATGNGNITDTGDSAVSAWGVVVNTTGTPTTSDTVFSGSGAGTTGAFTAAMTGLTANTLYYARAYATNGADTSYGSQVTFTTLAPPSAPTISSGGAISFTGTTATGTGYVASDGGASITARGGCWATTANPVASGSHATAAGTTGAFQISITGLSAGTRYHYRPYATNSIGTSYGADIQFVAATGGVVSHHHKKKPHAN